MFFPLSKNAPSRARVDIYRQNSVDRLFGVSLMAFSVLAVTHSVLQLLTLPADRLVHGNTLTAAVVIENIKAASKSITSALSGYESITSAPSVFLTGPTSKVGVLGVHLFPPDYFLVCVKTCRDAMKNETHCVFYLPGVQAEHKDNHVVKRHLNWSTYPWVGVFDR